MSLSKSIVTGKVSSNPESRFTNTDDPVTRVAITTGNGVEIVLVCYRTIAEKANNLKQGELVMASGNLITSTQQVDGGMSRKDFELNVRDLYILHGSIENLNPFLGTEGKPSSYSQNSQPQKAAVSSQSSSESNKEDLSDVLTEEEIPF